jgi:hypothetical protein
MQDQGLMAAIILLIIMGGYTFMVVRYFFYWPYSIGLFGLVAVVIAACYHLL